MQLMRAGADQIDRGAVEHLQIRCDRPSELSRYTAAGPVTRGSLGLACLACRNDRLGYPPRFWAVSRRQASVSGTSRMNREVNVRFCERLGVKFPGPTLLYARQLQLSGVGTVPIQARKLGRSRRAGRESRLSRPRRMLSGLAEDHRARWDTDGHADGCVGVRALRGFQRKAAGSATIRTVAKTILIVVEQRSAGRRPHRVDPWAGASDRVWPSAEWQLGERWAEADAGVRQGFRQPPILRGLLAHTHAGPPGRGRPPFQLIRGPAFLCPGSQ